MGEEMKKVELLPCPFCGSKDVQLDEWSMYNDSVRCNDCYAWGSVFKEFNRGKKAIAAWNKRALTEREKKLVKALKKIINDSIDVWEGGTSCLRCWADNTEKHSKNCVVVTAQEALSTLGINPQEQP